MSALINTRKVHSYSSQLRLSSNMIPYSGLYENLNYEIILLHYNQRHYPELYKYLKYEIFNWTVLTIIYINENYLLCGT